MLRTALFILGLCIILTGSLTACSDQKSSEPVADTYTIDILNTTAQGQNPIVDDIKFALDERGYLEGENTTYLDPMAEGESETRLEAVQTMLDADVDVILLGNPDDIEAAQQLTETVPLVLMSSLDPVGEGLVDSTVRPGGNITGVFIPPRDGRLLQYLRDRYPASPPSTYHSAQITRRTSR